jgi:uncharacterized membrane protein
MLSQSRTRHSTTNPIELIAFGASLMYFFDPTRGRRRRAIARDKFLSAVHHLKDLGAKTSQDLANRSRGLIAETAHRFQHDIPPDDVLEARVRSKLGRVVSHPHAIQVFVDNGDVVVSGQILRDEVPILLSTVRKVPGVRAVDAILNVHRTPGHVPALQGGHPRTGEQLDILQDNWSLATRAVVGSAGAAIAIHGFSRRGPSAKLIGLFGASLFVRAISNLDASRLTGIGAGRRAVDVNKSITIHAPVHEVFDFWRNYDNFPLFMHNVRNVQDLGYGQCRWQVAGPAGSTVQFDAGITAFEENRRIAWATEPGALIGSEGVVRFTPLSRNSTHVMIQMTYNPPAGAIGDAVAALFGADPKSEMDEDLARLKTLIETGNFPHDAARHASEAT